MTPHSLSTLPLPLIIAHRGYSSRALENSLSAFRLAVEAGCDGIELDIHLTRDGEIVVHHDRLVPGGQAIAELSLVELRGISLSDGSLIPTLEEVINVSAELELFIEAKALPLDGDDRLIEVFQRTAAPARLHVHSFDHRIIARLATRLAASSLGVLSTSYPIDPVGAVLDAGARVLWQEHQLIDLALVDRCAAAGIAVIAWTVNSAKDAEHLRELGVAGLCGNWPERLRL